MLPSSPLLRKQDFEDGSADRGNIKVVCRFRPFNQKEARMRPMMCASFDPDGKTVTINSENEAQSSLSFTFDNVFQPEVSQAIVYERAAKNIIDSVLEGFNGTVFAYGQTSSGKTFTMTGPSIDDEELKGIIPRMVRTVFDTIADSPDHLEFTVKVSYAEIYMEKIRDLIDTTKTNLKIHEDRSRGVYIADLTEEYVSEEGEVYKIIETGGCNREVGSTNMNEYSSRSHSIFSLTVTQNNTVDYSARTGKMYLVDLAGSEKVLKTGAENKRLEEAKAINKSLTMLGIVIFSLTEGKASHTPYRDSKLTRVLQDSLGGNSKTTLIITCSPHSYNEAETLSTLRFGTRAKAVKNKPIINRELTVDELKLMVAKLEREVINKDRKIAALEQSLTGSGGSVLSNKNPAEIEDHLNESKGDLYYDIVSQLDEERHKLAEELTKHSHLRKELASQMARSAKLSKENDSLIASLTTQAFKIANLEDRIQDHEEQADRQNAMVEALQLDFANLEEIKRSLEVKVDEAEKEVALLKQAQLESGLRRGISTRLVSQRDYLEIEILRLKADIEAKDTTLRQVTSELGVVPVAKLVSQAASISQLETQIATERAEKAVMANELQALRTQLDSALATSVPDLDLIKQHLIEETVKQEHGRWVIEKTELLKDLKAQAQNALRFEMELEETREQMKFMEETMTQTELTLKLKVGSLERNLEQLNQTYHKLISRQSLVNVENRVNAKKLKRKSDRCEELIGEVEVLNEHLAAYKQQCEDLQSQLTTLTRPTRNSVFIAGRSTFAFTGHNKIRKRIKGGVKASMSRIYDDSDEESGSPSVIQALTATLR